MSNPVQPISTDDTVGTMVADSIPLTQQISNGVVTAVADVASNSFLPDVPVTSRVVLVQEDDDDSVNQLRRQMDLLREQQEQERELQRREREEMQAALRLLEEEHGGRGQQQEPSVPPAASSNTKKKKPAPTSTFFRQIGRQTTAGMTNVGLSAYKTKKNAQIQATKFKIAERKKQFGLDYMTLMESKSTTERQLQECMQTALRDLEQLRNQLDRHQKKIVMRQEVVQEKLTASENGQALQTRTAPIAATVQSVVAMPIQMTSSNTPIKGTQVGNSRTGNSKQDVGAASLSYDTVASVDSSFSRNSNPAISSIVSGQNKMSRQEVSMEGKHTIETHKVVVARSRRDPDGDYVQRSGVA